MSKHNIHYAQKLWMQYFLWNKPSTLFKIETYILGNKKQLEWYVEVWIERRYFRAIAIPLGEKFAVTLFLRFKPLRKHSSRVLWEWDPLETEGMPRVETSTAIKYKQVEFQLPIIRLFNLHQPIALIRSKCIIISFIEANI